MGYYIRQAGSRVYQSNNFTYERRVKCGGCSENNLAKRSDGHKCNGCKQAESPCRGCGSKYKNLQHNWKYKK